MAILRRRYNRNRQTTGGAMAGPSCFSGAAPLLFHMPPDFLVKFAVILDALEVLRNLELVQLLPRARAQTGLRLTGAGFHRGLLAEMTKPHRQDVAGAVGDHGDFAHDTPPPLRL